MEELMRAGVILADGTSYRFVPKADITAYELSFVLAVLLNYSRRQYPDEFQRLDEKFHQLPPEVRRHFVQEKK